MLQKPIYLAILLIIVIGAFVIYLKNRNNQVDKNHSGKTATKADTAPIVVENKKGPELQANISAETRQQILGFFAEGKVADALQVLADYQPDLVDSIQKDLDALSAEKEHRSLIAFDEWFLEHNRIAFATSELLPSSRKATASVSSDHIQDLLDKEALEEALDVLMKAGDEEMALTKGQLTIIKEEEERNTITEAVAKVNKARIKYTISERL